MPKYKFDYKFFKKIQSLFSLLVGSRRYWGYWGKGHDDSYNFDNFSLHRRGGSQDERC